MCDIYIVEKEYWIERGKAVLDEKYWEMWEENVPNRVKGLYRGMEMELDYLLDVAAVLNNRGSFDAAYAIIENQKHSGMSYSLVCNMIKSFCDRGKAFIEFLESNR